MNLVTNIQARCGAVPKAEPSVDFVVVDVETACSRVSSNCQIGIVGFREGREVFAYETLIDPCDEFSSFNTRIHGIGCDHVVGKPTYRAVHDVVDAHLSGRVMSSPHRVVRVDS